MAKVALTDALRAKYEALFAGCTVRPERAAAVDGIIDTALANQARYAAVGTPMGIPWHFIAAIHNMESGQSFKGHLHNGDPLSARTVQVPAGRPKAGDPPFTWEQSAADALAMHGLGAATDWSVAGTLYQLEAYNGFGYRLYHPETKSPYLWSFSTVYTSGKYVADGTWSDTAKSGQCGAAVILRRMAERRLIAFADQPTPAPDAAPLVVRYTLTRPADPAAAIALQNWLTTHAGIFVKPDGVAGEKTSDAYKVVTGHFLPGDPRG